MENLTQAQRNQIVMEELKKADFMQLSSWAVLALGKEAVNANAQSLEASMHANIGEGRYSLQLKIRAKKVGPAVHKEGKEG